MNREKLADRVFEIGNCINSTAYKLYSAIDLLELIVKEAENNGLLDQYPFTGLRGTLISFKSVSDDMSQTENMSDSLTDMQTELCKENECTCITYKAFTVLKELYKDVSIKNIQVKPLSNKQCWILLNGMHIGTWDIENSKFVNQIRC